LTERITPGRTWPSSRVPARDDEVLLALVGLGHDHAELLVEVDRGIFHAIDVDLTDGQEPADAIHHDLEPALVDLGRSGLDDQSLAEIRPVGLDRRALKREDEQPFFMVEPIDNHLDDVARVRQRIRTELLDGQDTLALGREVHEQALAANADDLPLLDPGGGLLTDVGLLGMGPIGGSGPTRRLNVQFLGIETGHRGFKLVFQFVVPEPLEGHARRGKDVVLAGGFGIQRAVDVRSPQNLRAVVIVPGSSGPG
jgi:hypothetical protein